MDMASAIRACLGKYASFRGRARRAEFWWFTLFLFIGNMVLTFADSFLFGTVNTYQGGFDAQTNTPILSGLFLLATFLPSISVTVRRLHDTGRSGWWYWLWLVPIVGMILLIIWLASRGTAGPNAYGPDPLDDDAPPDGGEHEAGYVASSVPTVRRRR